MPAAEIVGTLRLIDDCLIIDDLALVWTDQATWNEAEQAVEVGSSTYAVGDQVNLGGGAINGSGWRDVIDEDAHAAVEACLDLDGVQTVAIVT